MTTDTAEQQATLPTATGTAAATAKQRRVFQLWRPATVGLVVLVSACGTGAATEKSTLAPAGSTMAPADSTLAPPIGPPYIGPLTFNWASDCTVPVAETVTKRGSTAHLSYGMQIVAEVPNRVVSLVDMVIADIDGSPVSDPASIAAFHLPSFVVDDAAAVVEVRGLDEMFDDAQNVTGADPALLTPELRATLTETVTSKYWGTWAGFWASVGSIGVSRVETIMSVPMGDSQIDTTILLESLGTTADGLAILRHTQTIDGENFLRAMGIVTGNNEAPAASDSGHQIITIDVTTNPSTLRPASAQIVTNMEFTTAAGTQSMMESRTWTFDWLSSDCAP
jgi:hypothetical protein